MNDSMIQAMVGNGREIRLHSVMAAEMPVHAQSAGYQAVSAASLAQVAQSDCH